MRLSKGFEVEIYTGKPTGEIVGLSDRIAADLSGFMREPDSRNVEYTTPPLQCYDRLLCELVQPRMRLRRYLAQLGDYTLIPGSTLSLEMSDRFHRSDPNNPYHTYIEQTYGIDVVTASIHINVGISDPDELMAACRLVRLEAPLYLALSASSPFLRGDASGSDSSRWQMFPKTPAQVPLFESHSHYIRWTEEQLALGTMQNVRHLWGSVRPNGDRRPYNLNRLELRICDLVTDPISLLAITALLEARIMQLMQNPNLDPLIQYPHRADELVAIADENEQLAARDSLNAQLIHWQTGQPIVARDWITAIYDEVLPIAKANGYACFLTPLKKILREGNVAQQWRSLHNQGISPQQILTQAIQKLAEQEQQLESAICESALAA
ncbi:MAG: glutamate--cysteine ligase [Leptolyngbyaceae bacterium]|nr:glutamate--cysteine ligase [Leptolyngbyaceae bacterium]